MGRTVQEGFFLSGSGSGSGKVFCEQCQEATGSCFVLSSLSCTWKTSPFASRMRHNKVPHSWALRTSVWSSSLPLASCGVQLFDETALGRRGASCDHFLARVRFSLLSVRNTPQTKKGQARTKQLIALRSALGIPRQFWGRQAGF